MNESRVLMMGLTSVPKLFLTDSPRILLLTYFANIDVMLEMLRRYDRGAKANVMAKFAFIS